MQELADAGRTVCTLHLRVQTKPISIYLCNQLVPVLRMHLLHTVCTNPFPSVLSDAKPNGLCRDAGAVQQEERTQSRTPLEYRFCMQLWK